MGKKNKLSKLEKEELKKLVAVMRGSSKRKTTDEDIHKAGEKVFLELEKKFK